MKTIPLTKGQFAIVDDEDYKKLSRYSWCATKIRNGYVAIRTIHKPKKYNLYMHRHIMNCPKGLWVDHINHDTLDNRKENLRIVTPSQNMMNRLGARKNKKLNIRGVYFHEGTGKYRAMIRVYGKLKHLGLYKTTQEASKAYADANMKYFGNFGGFINRHLVKYP